MNIFSNVIQFSCHPDYKGVLPEPKTSNKLLPEWFKKIKPYNGVEKENKFPIRTAKKCMPLLDAMNLGFIITMPIDLRVMTNNDLSIIKIEQRSECFEPIDYHDWVQVESDKWPIRKQHPIKFKNPWLIKTKPGWSCLFTSPLNHLNNDYQVFSGVVDTDRYKGVINFPGVWKSENFDGIIKAGTPLVQVIPFKRNKNKLVVKEQTQKEIDAFHKVNMSMSLREGVYTNEIREPR